jgi:hypothetical protein
VVDKPYLTGLRQSCPSLASVEGQTFQLKDEIPLSAQGRMAAPVMSSCLLLGTGPSERELSSV